MLQINQETQYCYTFIRTDLPIEQQIVQAAHSAHQAGRLYPAPIDTHLILLEVKNEFALQKISNDLTALNIQHHLFHEPDDERGYTSITTEPLTDPVMRNYFSRFSLYRYRSEKSFSIKEELFN